MTSGEFDPRGTLDLHDYSIDQDAPATLWALTILYHPSIALVGHVAMLGALADGASVGLSRTEPEVVDPRTGEKSCFADEHLSRTPVWLRPRADGGIRVDLAGSSTKVTLRRAALHDHADLGREELIRGVVLTLKGGIVVLLHPQGPLGASSPSFGLIGESAGIRRVRHEIQRVADLDFPVLVRGETGTGKELVARAVHEASPRRGGPFVAVNLGAIPTSLATAELFGAAAGAYTGAGRGQQGYFNAARGGTLFLDEIGEASPEVQGMLLRALESGDIQGVGAQRAQKADVRVISATDAKLEARIADETFRAPLLHRLASFGIFLPPLRERRDDIGRLVVHFLHEELRRVGDEARFERAMGWSYPWLPASLVARLADLDWPGNVRQLRNVIRQLVVGSRDRERVELTPPVERLLREAEDAAPRRARPLMPPPASPQQAPPPPPVIPQAPPEGAPPATLPPSEPAPSASRRRPSEVTQAELAAALREARWELAATAARLRISRASLYVLIENNPALRKAGDLTAEEITAAHRECGGDLSAMAARLEVSVRALQRRAREIGLDARGDDKR